MQKITISIDEINNNPNLDISERLANLKNKYNDKYSEDDLKSLAIASIKQEYELFANNRINFTKEADDLLEKIKNGGELSNKEAFILNCDDPQIISEYSKLDDIKKQIKEDNAITLNDFNFLCEAMKLDSHTKRLLEIGYKSKGLISDYSQSVGKISLDDFNFLCETMKLDPYMKRLLEIGYKSKGLISDYSQSVVKISLDDFEYLCSSTGMDDEIKSVLLAEFQNKGLISEFKLENSEKHHK